MAVLQITAEDVAAVTERYREIEQEEHAPFVIMNNARVAPIIIPLDGPEEDE